MNCDELRSITVVNCAQLRQTVSAVDVLLLARSQGTKKKLADAIPVCHTDYFLRTQDQIQLYY